MALRRVWPKTTCSTRRAICRWGDDAGGEEGAVEDYLSFLKAGNSMYPVDALKMAGVDLSKPDAVEETFDVLAGMVDRLEELVG